MVKEGRKQIAESSPAEPLHLSVLNLTNSFRASGPRQFREEAICTSIKLKHFLMQTL